MNLKERITSLCTIMSISGSETCATAAVTDLYGADFDEHRVDALGNHLFIKRCGRPDAPVILLDTHLDEIGMMVTGVKDGGFLSIAPIGGVDTRILPSAEVVVYGKETLYGVIGSVPPHVQKPGDNQKLPPMDELFVDIGYAEADAKDLVPLGTPVGFKPVYTELLNGRLCGKAFDDKACAACALEAVTRTPAGELVGDVYVLLSSCEELGGRGAAVAGFGIRPDYALVVDVTHAAVPEVKDEYLSEMDSGVVITHSAVTDRRLTRMTVELCGAKGIPYTVDAAPGNTGTNANVLGNCADGIPTVLVSLPIKSMHSATEELSLRDAETLVDTVRAFVTSAEIKEVFAQ